MAFYRFGTRGPMDELLRIQQDMSRMMQSWSEQRVPDAWPPVNVYDDGDNFYVRSELAGLDREKLDVTVAGDVLTLKIVRNEDEVDGGWDRDIDEFRKHHQR